MFRDLSGLLFTSDGVPADLVRAGESRLTSYRDTAAERTAAQVPVRRHALLRWLRTLSTS